MQLKQKRKKVNSFVTVDREGALKRAEEVQKMIDDGTLTGPLCRSAGRHQGQYVHERSADDLFLKDII